LNSEVIGVEKILLIPKYGVDIYYFTSELIYYILSIEIGNRIM